MELRHLRYFVAVAEEQNVTRAAARLHVSQPPLSRQVRDLEEELGVALLERRAKSIHLTEAGRIFLGEARAVLRRTEEAVRVVRAAATGEAGELPIGYAPSPTARILPPALQAFQERHPRVKVRLHDRTSPEMLTGLRDRTLQLALMTQPSRQAAPGIVFEPLATYPVIVAVAPRHPFSRRRAVTVRELLGEPIVAYARDEYPDYHAFLARVLGPAAKRLRVVEECDGGMSLTAAVAANHGVAISALSLAHLAGRRVRYVPLAPAPAPLVVGVAYRRDGVPPIALRFVACAREAARGAAGAEATGGRAERR